MIKEFFRTLLSYLLFGLIIGIVLLPGIIMLLMPKRWLHKSRIFFWFSHAIYWAIIKVLFMPVVIVGKENMLHAPAIIAANHQSSLDVPLVGITLLGAPHVWLAKAELKENPFLRFILSRLAIIIDMSTPMTGMRSLIKALDTFEDSPAHAVIFPEGGRYTDGAVHDFYAGFAILAKKTGRPVVPVRIFNAYKVYPPGSFLLHWVPIKVVIGQPFIYQEGEKEDVFVARVHDWFLAQKED